MTVKIDFSEEDGKPHWLARKREPKTLEQIRQEHRDRWLAAQEEERAKRREQQAKDWDESEHPRDEDGKFSGGGGGGGSDTSASGGGGGKDKPAGDGGFKFAPGKAMPKQSGYVKVEPGRFDRQERGVRDVELFVNPSRGAVERLAKESTTLNILLKPEHSVRVAQNDAGNLFVWKAEEATHSELTYALFKAGVTDIHAVSQWWIKDGKLGSEFDRDDKEAREWIGAGQATAEKATDGDDNDQAPTSAGFVSPNVKTNLDFAGAVKELNSAQQATMRDASANINEVLGLTDARDVSIIGAWSDGAENSVMMQADSDWDHTVLATVMKGHLADQKSVLVFQQQEDGQTVLAHFEAKGDLATIHKNLLKDGLENHTIVPTPDGARVYVVDLDGSAADAIKTGASRYGAENKVSIQFGRGEFIPPFDQQTGETDRDQRDGARRIYETVIGRSSVSGAAKIWQGVRDRWGKALTEPEQQLPLAAAYTQAERLAIDARARALLRGGDWDESEHPRDEDGKFGFGGGGGGGGGSDSSSGGGGRQGSVEAIAGLPKVSNYKAGLVAKGESKKIDATKAAWIKSSPIKTIDHLIDGGPKAQAALGRVGAQITEKLKINEFKNPGPKTKSEKGIARTNEKIAKYKGDAGAVTDVARCTFIVDSPAQSDAIAAELGKHFEVTLENWRANDQGYMDRAALVRFDNGMIGEVQFMDRGMSDAKSDKGGDGHGLYVKWRALDPKKPEERARADALVEQMKTLYGGVTSAYSPEWKAVFQKA